MDTLRRAFLRRSLKTAGIAAMAPAMAQISRPAQASSTSLVQAGPLQAPDDLGIRLPVGFSSRRIAQAFYRVPNTRKGWHIFPDGGACFETDDAGWIYVSNSEFPAAGGVQAVRFNALGDIVDAYNILSGTSLNCAGGATPWNTWLSCEEHDLGFVWECDPYGNEKAVKRPYMGMFKHEAVAVDPINQHLYLTEDTGDGCFYRFTPDDYPNLESGLLEVAVIDGFDAATDIDPDAIVDVRWLPVEAPFPQFEKTKSSALLNSVPTRYQVEDATHFRGGEGIWYHDQRVFFTTKGDNRVWELDLQAQKLSILYDINTNPNPILSGVDNVTVAPSGEVIVAEDGGDMQLVAINEFGDVAPIVQVVDQDHSEITGPAFNPAGKRLYFSSQRGPKKRFPQNLGITYEVLGPF
ncbi:MAG: PhoX family protein [Pseudomonadales bacterium]|nr:PhoX family protein [Pseudomonadales bacterium]